ncbi:hypothetical protein TSAR_003389 [Trichomalopsis sarcophagae]|uniref:Uncharacterized protein n=1 Tax=Trichomalopsis sarcophagae TaxID=543379 RepID=A0A232FBT1_9HYME|nr:hypothetical protein TSAR_003389 [Trichomalopsis sarcophagae]
MRISRRFLFSPALGMLRVGHLA